MNHPGKFPKFIKFILAFPIFAVLVLMGCAGEPVQVEFPINHPANPEAQETEFTPPPNPFQEDVTAMKGESTPDSMMKHKTHEERSKQPMDHDMGTNKGSEPDSESTKKSGDGEGGNQHQEHNQ